MYYQMILSGRLRGQGWRQSWHQTLGGAHLPEVQRDDQHHRLSFGVRYFGWLLVLFGETELEWTANRSRKWMYKYGV